MSVPVAQTSGAGQEGHPARWTYDLAGRLLQSERALSVGSQIDDFLTAIDETFTYDKNHRLISVTDDNFNTTSYEYDALSRLTRTLYADSKDVRHTWDANGNVHTSTDQNGTVVTNTYDGHDRLTGRSISRGTGVQGTTSESFSYDDLDQVLTAVDDDFQVELTWDSVGNLLQERQGYNSSGNEKWKTVASGWTDAGSRSAVTYPSGFVVGNSRDAIYRLTAIQDINAAATIASFTWQGRDRLKKTTNQNGTTTDYLYDGFQRVSSIDHQTPGGLTYHKYEYAYDKVHNRRMEKNTFNSTWVATLPTAVQTFLNGRGGKGDVYAYDWADRLVDVRYDTASPASEVASPGSQSFGKLVQFTLDGLGNRSQVQVTPPTPATTTTYSSDVMNQYTAVGSTSRSHDDNGNATDDATYLWVFDYTNHVVEVKDKSTSSSIATYKYDALGRRVEMLDGQAEFESQVAGLEATADCAAGMLIFSGMAAGMSGSLAEKLTMEEAKSGAGNRIMEGVIKDPKYPGDVWAKMQHVHDHPGGTKTVVHYWKNLQTGVSEGFKLK